MAIGSHLGSPSLTSGFCFNIIQLTIQLNAWGYIWKKKRHRGRQRFDTKERANGLIKSFCEEINEKLISDSQYAATYTLDQLGIDFAQHMHRRSPYARSSIINILKRNNLYWSNPQKRIIPLDEFNKTTIEGSYEIVNSVYHVFIQTTSLKVSNCIKNLLAKDDMISDEILAIVPLEHCVIIYSNNANIKQMTKKRLSLLIQKTKDDEEP